MKISTKAWHPVGEALPEIPEGSFAVEVLCTVNDGDCNIVIHCMYVKDVGFQEGICTYDGDEWIETYDPVIAWMYLPLPYEDLFGGSDGE